MTAICVFSLLMDVVVVYLMLGLNFRAVDLHATPAQLGLLQASFAVPYTLLCFFMARRFSSLNARAAMTLSSLALVVLCILSAAVSSLTSFLILAVLVGTSTAFFWPPLEHYVARNKSSHELYGALSRFNLWWGSGYAIGTATCGLLLDWDYRLVFFAAAGCLVPIAAGSAFLPSAPSVESWGAGAARSSPTAVALGKKRFCLTISRVFIFLTYASAGTILALFPKLGDTLHFGKPLISRVLAFFYIGQLASFLILAKTKRWHYNVPLLLAAQGVSVAAFLAAFAWNRMVVFSAAFGAVGLVAGLSYFSSLYYTLHEPVFRTSLAGVHEAILAGGRLLGPLFLGAVASRFNLKTPYLCLAITFALYLTFTFLASRGLERGDSKPGRIQFDGVVVREDSPDGDVSSPDGD